MYCCGIRVSSSLNSCWNCSSRLSEFTDCEEDWYLGLDCRLLFLLPLLLLRPFNETLDEITDGMMMPVCSLLASRGCDDYQRNNYSQEKERWWRDNARIYRKNSRKWLVVVRLRNILHVALCYIGTKRDLEKCALDAMMCLNGVWTAMVSKSQFKYLDFVIISSIPQPKSRHTNFENLQNARQPLNRKKVIFHQLSVPVDRVDQNHPRSV